MRQTSVEQADHSEPGIERLLGRNGIRLGEPQLRRLAWLARRFGAPTVWDHGAQPEANQGFAIVIDPPNGARADLLCRSLHAGSAVAIPFGENPGFDFLKSKLTDFGTIGACGIDYPHELWWGGLGWPMLKLDSAAVAKAPRVVSCHPAGLGENYARRLKQSLARFELEFDIEPIDAVFDDRMFGFEKADSVARMWDRHGGPLLFVEADAVLQAPPLLPARLGCDFAAHRWNRWEMSARTIYFGNSTIAESLLRTWQDLSATYPSVWDGYLLDQAWSLTSSQMPLDTVWLPRSYHALVGDVDVNTHPRAAIVHNLPTTSFDLGPDPGFSDVARGARRAGRTGARDSLLVVNSQTPSESGVTVILRDIEASGARTIAARIEAVTDAFAADCGGFGRLELSLCPWKEDVRVAKEAARNANNRVIEIAPWQELSGDLFRSFARSSAAGHVRAVTDRRG
jgi:hypothetical protein